MTNRVEDNGAGLNGEERLLQLATNIVSSFVAHNPLPSTRLSDLIHKVHETLKDVSEAEGLKASTQKPAVAANKSVTHDYLICLEDGKKLKMLKRHLRSKYGLSPDQYRRKWDLPKDYPMVAPGYAEKRSKLARQIGLGRKAAYVSK